MRQPTYPLARVKQLFENGQFNITYSALATATLVNCLDDDIVDCVTNHLSESHFYKTMASETVPGLMQDVYKLRYEGQRIYIKLQIRNDRAVVVSFKEDVSSA
jgi:hypothetical protein